MIDDNRTAELAAERFGELHCEFENALAKGALGADEASAVTPRAHPTWVVGWFHERGLCVDAHLHPIVPGEVLIEPIEVKG